MTDRYRIVHLIDGLTVGGAEMMLYRLVSRMDTRYFDNRVVTFLDKGPIGEMIERAGIPVYALGMRQGHPSLLALLRLLAILRETRPHILQGWMYLAGLLAAHVAPMVRGTRIVWNIRSSTYLPENASSFTRWVRRSCTKLSHVPEAVIINSLTGMRDHSSLGYRPRHWVMLPNGFDVGTFAPNPSHRTSVRQELALAEDTPLIGIAGRFHPVKDHLTFLQAAQRLHVRRPWVHFLMIGEEMLPENPVLAAALTDDAFRNVVHLVGCRDDVPRLLAGIDIFTLTSLAEGFPNVIGEAMCCGTPCVVTDTAGDAPDIIGDTGIVVPRQVPGALASAWERLLNEKAETRELRARQARERILAQYEIGKVVHDYEALYTAIAGNTQWSTLAG